MCLKSEIKLAADRRIAVTDRPAARGAGQWWVALKRSGRKEEAFHGWQKVEIYPS